MRVRAIVETACEHDHWPNVDYRGNVIPHSLLTARQKQDLFFKEGVDFDYAVYENPDNQCPGGTRDVVWESE